MSDDDVKAAISAAVAETGAAGMKDMGKVIARAEGEIRRPDGFRQSQRHGEGGAGGLTCLAAHCRPKDGSLCSPCDRASFSRKQRVDVPVKPGPRHKKTRDDASAAMLTEATTYDELYHNFRWDIPARFNMATACCDRYADGSGRLALVYVDEDGGTTRTSFDEVADMSRRFANVLKADGLVRGDRVAVFLSQSLELPIAHLAAFRSGLISIPLFALFGEDALEFRLSNSEAQGHRHRRRPAGKSWQKSATGCPSCKNVYVTGDMHARRHQTVLAGAEIGIAEFHHRRYLVRRSRAHHLHLGHHG